MGEIRVITERSGDRRVDVLCGGVELTVGRGPTRESALECARRELGRLTAEVDELSDDED